MSLCLKFCFGSAELDIPLHSCILSLPATVAYCAPCKWLKMLFVVAIELQKLRHSYWRCMCMTVAQTYPCLHKWQRYPSSLPQTVAKLTKTCGSEFGALLWRHLMLQRKLQDGAQLYLFRCTTASNSDVAIGCALHTGLALWLFHD